MSNKQKTALQLLIAELEEQSKTCPMSDRKFYIYCKMLATQKLPMEKEQMLDIWSDGNDYSSIQKESFEQYYKETYEK